jgi:hypothetical protein
MLYSIHPVALLQRLPPDPDGTLDRSHNREAAVEAMGFGHDYKCLLQLSAVAVREMTTDPRSGATDFNAHAPK